MNPRGRGSAPLGGVQEGPKEVDESRVAPKEGGYRRAWLALGRAFWPLVNGAGLLLLIDLCAGAVRLAYRSRAIGLEMWRVVVLVVFILLARYFVRCFFVGGYLSMHARAARGEKVTTGLLSSRISLVGRVMVAQLTRSIVVVLFTGLASAPFIALSYAGEPRGWRAASIWPAAILAPCGFLFAYVHLVLTDWFVVVGGLGPFAALAASWRRASAHRGKILGALLLTRLVEIAGWLTGLLLFVVGALFTVPATRAYGDAVFTALFFDLDPSAPSTAPGAKRASQPKKKRKK